MAIEAGRLLDVSGVGDPVSVLQHDLEVLEDEINKFTPSFEGGVATTVIGPPTSGDHILDELWKDAWNAWWRCTAAGNPGTWRQETPAVREGEPGSGTIPTGYQILDASDNYNRKRHLGSYSWRRESCDVLTGSATLDFGSIASAGSEDLTITVTGAAVNDEVALGLPSAPTAGIVFFAFVSASDTVTVRAMNITAGAIDPASATYSVRILKT